MNMVSRVRTNVTDRIDKFTISEARVSAFRIHRHHLDLSAPSSRLPSVVGDVCGVQAQVTAMARIALWARLRQLNVDDVERALVRKRTIVKTWSMRGALHLLASNELLLYLRGLMPTRLPREQRWIEGAGLKEEETTAMILDALKNGPLTRVQLVAYLAKRLGTKAKDWMDGGWGRTTTGSNTSWQLVRPAVMRGLVCFGPSNGQEITFTRVDRWLRGHGPCRRKRRPRTRWFAGTSARSARPMPRICGHGPACTFGGFESSWTGSGTSLSRWTRAADAGSS